VIGRLKKRKVFGMGKRGSEVTRLEGKLAFLNSCASREILIEVVDQSIPTYLMRIFKLLFKLLVTLIEKSHNFLALNFGGEGGNEIYIGRVGIISANLNILVGGDLRGLILLVILFLPNKHRDFIKPVCPQSEC